MAVLNHIAQLWWQWMGPMLLQVTVLILIISGLELILKKWAWPQIRYGLWILVLIKLLIPPGWYLPSSVISHFQPHIKQAVLSRVEIAGTSFTTQDRISESSIPEQTTAHSPAETLPQPEKQAISPLHAETGEKPVWQTWAMGIWLFGILIYLTLLIGKMKKLRSWHQQQKDKDIPPWFHKILVQTAQRLNLDNLPAIVFSDKAVTPAVYGMFRPVLLLPANYFDTLSENEAKHVLLHELAHLKRGDLWLHGLSLFLQIIYWFNPLMLWVRKQMKHVREICCDFTVANILREKTGEYRQTLLNTARELLTEKVEPGLGLLGVFEEPFWLVTRLKWLEKKPWQNQGLALAAAFFAALIITFSILPMAGAEKTRPTSSTIDISGNVSESVLPEITSAPVQDSTKINFNITIKNTDPLYAAVLPVVGPPNDLFEVKVKQVTELLKKSGIKPTGSPFGRYFSDPEKVTPENSYWEVGYPVKVGTKVNPPLEIIRVAGWQMASAVIEGVKNTDPVWDRFLKRLETRGYVPGFPPAMEIWTGEFVNKEFWWRTELLIQAFRPETGYPGMDITIKKTEPMTALVLPMDGSYAQLPGAVEKLNNYIRQKKIKPAGPQFGRFFTSQTTEIPENYYWEMCCPVEPGTEAEPPFEIQEIDSNNVVSAVFNGPANYEYPWGAFLVMSVLKGKIPGGPGIEVYSPDQKKNPWIELQIPVMHMSGFVEDMIEWGENLGREMQKMGNSLANSMVTPAVKHKVCYIKTVNKIDTYTFWKKTKSEFDYIGELWIDEDKTVLIEKNKKLIYDQGKMTFSYINLRDSTFVDTGLPVDLSNLFTDDLYWNFKNRKVTGKVKETNKTLDILSKQCKLTELTFWDLIDGSKKNKRVSKVWTTMDVPCNVELFHNLLRIMRTLYNRDESLINEMEKLLGIQMQVEITITKFPRKKVYLSTVEEISQMVPPDGVFSVPDGFEKKEKLSKRDMNL
ncbi:GyrI-like domain-containing protein [candidate division KSB1 bacterium]|nr:GyrI-like domain-containing protein [candidate division KSB1 bacterium]